MKKFGILAVIMLLAAISLVSAAGNLLCTPTVTLVSQDPYPAVPDSYVEIVFQVTGLEGSNCANGAWFEIYPAYPFSLDSAESKKVLEANTFVNEYNGAWMIPYKLRVDKDALSGTYKLNAHYGQNEVVKSISYLTKSFNLTVKDSRTLFDAVIQDVSETGVTIAIANAGKNTANSVVVRIPTQDGFEVSGTDGQMVGNLESGDYTVVSFEVTKKMSRPMTGTQAGETEEAKPDEGAKLQGTFDAKASELSFDIYYTDTIGERRIVNLALPLSIKSSTSSALSLNGNGFSRGNFARQNQSSISWLQVIISVLATLVVAFAAFKLISRRKKSAKSAEHVPDWIKEKGGKK